MQHDFFLLDRSGSMRGLWTEVIGAINSYSKKLADDDIDTGVTVATFDEDAGTFKFEVIRDRITPKTFLPIPTEDKDLQPRGMTPLNDAIARIVRLAEAGVPGSGQQYDKVALTIVTDGLENASKEHSHFTAKQLLDGLRAKGWQVIFIGANFDNAAQATSYGNAARQTTRVAPGKMGLVSEKLSVTRAAYASGAANTMDFTDEDKAELA